MALFLIIAQIFHKCPHWFLIHFRQAGCSLRGIWSNSPSAIISNNWNEKGFVQNTFWCSWKSCHLIDVQSCFCFLIYFELPKPVIVAEDIACTSYTQKNKFKWICINTTDSKLKTYKRMRLEPFIYLLFVQEDLMIYYLFVSHWPLFDVISISVTEQNVRFSAILALNLALRTFWELSG